VTGAQIVESRGNIVLDRAALEAVLRFRFKIPSSYDQDRSLTIEMPFDIEPRRRIRE